MAHGSDTLLGHNGTFAMAPTDLSYLARSARRLQENVERAGPAAGASYTMIGALGVLGGLGYAIDAWRGTSPWFLVGGLLFGIVVGMWGLARTVFHR
jgi:F0F1-type ATP synthase assembly protein I